MIAESNERRLGLEHQRSAAEEEALNQRMAIEHQRFCQVNFLITYLLCALPPSIISMD